jgi:hypothetical protein
MAGAREAIQEREGFSPDRETLRSVGGGNMNNERLPMPRLSRHYTTALDDLPVRILAEFDDATLVYEQLLKLGVIVRPMTSFGLERALRITVGTPEENARLVEALRTVFGKGAARS